METSPEAERFRVAAELYETGLDIQRQNLRRRHPDATKAEIEALMIAWLEDRPLDYSPT